VLGVALQQAPLKVIEWLIELEKNLERILEFAQLQADLQVLMSQVVNVDP
jgi:hypothetical protein